MHERLYFLAAGMGGLAAHAYVDIRLTIWNLSRFQAADLLYAHMVHCKRYMPAATRTSACAIDHAMKAAARFFHNRTYQAHIARPSLKHVRR